MFDDAGAVHLQGVVEVPQSLGLTPDDGADHRSGGGDPEDAPAGEGEVVLEHELAGLDFGEGPDFTVGALPFIRIASAAGCEYKHQGGGHERGSQGRAESRVLGHRWQSLRTQEE